MKAKIVGVQHVDFVSDKGESVQGVKLHYVTAPTENQASHFEGERVDTAFVRKGTELYSTLKIKLNEPYDFIYDFDGRRAYLVDIKPSA